MCDEKKIIKIFFYAIVSLFGKSLESRRRVNNKTIYHIEEKLHKEEVS